MNFLSDILTYMRRIIKSPSNAVITDALLIDYVNRFWIMDVPAILQLFDLKTKYQFITTPGVDQYNMPLYNLQTETTSPSQTIGMYPVYQGFLDPVYIDGVQVTFQTQKANFFNIYPNVIQELGVVAVGDGTASYTIQFPIGITNSTPINPPVNSILRGHVDITGIMATGNNVDPPLGTTINTSIPTTSIFPAVYITTTNSLGESMVVCDSGQFLNSNVNLGLLMSPGSAPFGNSALAGGYGATLNVVDYFQGIAYVTFPSTVASGVNINAKCYFYNPGLPRAVLYYNNTLTFRSPPDNQYLIELDAYLSPAAFFNTSAAIPFGYMAEYIARGAARKILSDTGDVEQMSFYEPLFKEQESFVWKRSQRQFTANRTETIYSQGLNQGQNGFAGFGASGI